MTKAIQKKKLKKKKKTEYFPKLLKTSNLHI